MAEINNGEAPLEPIAELGNEIPEVEDPGREEEAPEVPPPKRFSLPKISTKAAAWNLPEELAAFLQERCTTHLSEKELEEFTTTAAPNNIKGALKLDPFMRTLLERKGMNRVLSIDDEQQKIHEKLFQVMGPLSAAWLAVQNVVNGEEEDPDPDTVLKHLNDSLVLLGQAINKIGYERRLAILSTLNDNKQARKQLRENQDEINKESKFLFGEEFQKQLKACAKAQESADKLLSKSLKRKLPPTDNQPNQAGSSRASTRPTGGASSWSKRGRGSFHKKGKKINHSEYPKQQQPVDPRESKVGSPKPKRSFFKKLRNRITPISRQTEILSGKLVKDNSRPEYLRDCERLETSTERQTTSMEGAKSDSNEGTGKEGCNRGNSFNDSKGCSDRGSKCERSVHLNNFCQAKKGAKQISTNNKSEEIKCPPALHPFQNGRDEKCVGPVESGGLYGQDRPQRCLLAHRDSSGIKEISSFSLGPKTIRNGGTSFWGRSRTQNFHKVTESPTDNTKKTNVKISGILRRSLDNRENNRRNITSKGLSPISITKTGVYNKLGEVSSSTNAGSRVFGHDSKQYDNDSMASKREDSKTVETMSEYPSTEKDHVERISQSHREATGNASSNNNGSDANKSITTGPDLGSAEKSELRRDNFSVSRITGRPPVVGKQHNVESRCPTEIGQPRHGLIHGRLIRGGLGCIPGRGEIDRGSMDQGGERQVSHQRTRVVGSRDSSENFSKISVKDDSSYCHGQYDSSTLPNSQRGDQVKSSNRDIQEDMGVLVSTGDHDYCIVDPIQREQKGRLEIPTKSQFERMGTLSKSVPEASRSLGNTRDRLFCLKDNEQTASVHVTKPRSELLSNKCTASGLGKLSLSVPPILSHRESSKNVGKETNCKSSFNSSSLARASLVSSSTENVNFNSNLPSSKEGFINESHENASPADTEQISTLSGVSSIRKQYKEKGFSESASEIMLHARRESTTRAYKSPWNKWVLWCNERQTNPITAPVNLVVEFLSNLYHQGLEYRTINVYRSAISAYHSQVNNIPIGQTKEVCTLLSGIDNLRPPTPKYNVIWEVETVVSCLRNLGDDRSLSDKDLTLKTAMLMALTAIKRCSDLHILDKRFMAVGKDKIVFKILGKPKNFRGKGKLPDPVTYWASGSELCPVSTINAYIERTTPWREENPETQFFLSYKKPHQAITSSTIGRWLKTVLANVGVDTSKFTAHSVRAASSSKYKTLGASVSEIMNCGNWNSSSVWQSFYHKPITSDLREAQKTMLSC